MTTSAAKLDLVLRGAALLPEHAGKHAPGTVLYAYSYERLHDLCRPANTFGDFGSEVDTPAEVVAAKRKWVGEQLRRLEALALIRRVERPGRRPYLIVLRDDGRPSRSMIQTAQREMRMYDSSDR